MSQSRPRPGGTAYHAGLAGAERRSGTLPVAAGTGRVFCRRPGRGRAGAAGRHRGRGFPAPHHQAPAQAPELGGAGLGAGGAPRVEVPGHRVVPVVPRYRWAQEAAHLEPLPPPQRPTGGGQDQARVQGPQGAPGQVAGRVELEAGDGPSGLYDPHQLAQGGGRVGYVTEQVGEGESVEGGIGEGQVLGPPQDQVDPPARWAAAQVGLGGLQHLRGDVDPGHLRPGTSGQLQGDPARPGSDVEHPARRHWGRRHRGRRHRGRRHRGDGHGHGHGIDHRPPPPSVLAEGQHLSQVVVTGGEPIEELAGEAVRARSLHVVLLVAGGDWGACRGEPRARGQ